LALKNDLFLAARADRWILAHHAAHDCHSSIDVKMHPSAIVHGPPEGGKSHLFNSALDNTAIPDTVTPVLESSEKAYYVHDDTMGVIMRVDEAPKIWVDGKAADADKSGTAERIKSMTTEHKATYRTLVLIEGANGRTERRAETIESLFHATMWICTNKMVSHGDEAIASRFFNFIMTRSECDLFEFASLKEHLNDDDRNRKADSIHAWRVKQALLAISLVLIDSQILPRPSMDVFDHIHTRVLAYFKEQGVNTNAIRKATLPQFSLEFSIFNPMDEKVDMVNRVAVIYTVLNGLICLYDNPGAKYFGKEFELSQLMDLVPYLYCTKQIAIFTMTQTEEVFLNPLRSAVLRAVMVMAKLPYVRGKTIEQYFKEDVTRSLGRTWRQEDHGDRGRFYDFNYVAVGGADFKDIYSNIAECCDIKVGANEVQSVLEGLSGNASGYIRVNRVQPIREDFYTNLTSPGILNYTGLTREPNLSPLQIVVRDFKNKILFVATEAINKLHDDLLMDAFQACMYSTWQPQELLLAYEVRKQDPVHLDRDVTYVGLFDVLRVTPELVAEYSFVESYSAPNVAYVTPTTASILSGPRLHADKVGESYATNREKRSKTTMSIKEDLDVWGHKQHHYRAGHPGKPQDSPSYPNTVRESVRRALQLNEDRHRANELPGQDAASMHTGLMPKCLKICYPLTIIDELDDELIDKSSARPFTAIATATQQAYNLSLAEWKRTKVGPMPVLQTMGGAGRLARSNFALAEVANKGAAQTDGRRRAGPHSRNRTKWVDYKRQTLGGLQPEPLIAEMPINMEAWHARKQLILAKRRQIAMGNATAALPLTEGGGGGAHIDVDATTATITTTGYDELAYLSNLLPSDFDMTALPAPIESLPPPSAQQQQQQTRPQPQTVMSTSYTMQGDMVVLTKGIRPKAGPLTSSSTSASSASTSSKGLKKAPPLRRTASEAFDEEARAILMRSISMGFGDSGGGGAGSSLSSHSTGSRDSAGEGYDAEDSRHLIKKKQPRVVLDEDPDGVPPPPSLLDDEGDNALEPMDMDQVEQEDDDDDDEDNNEIDLEDYEVEQEDE
jgi:hypothetical protein